MKAIGIILAGGNNDYLDSLTERRAAAAMPVGSCYRAIDFTLSSMSNSGINKVAVLTQYNSRSLQDHLISSKWWDFGRKQGGLFVFTPYTSRNDSTWFRGTADSIYQNITYLKRSNEPYVVITSGDTIYKMNYSNVIKYHIEKKSDITIIYKNMKDKDLSKFGILELDDDNRLQEFEEKPLQAQSSDASLGIYVISRTLLINLLERIIPEQRYDIVKDIIIRFRKELKIYGYEFNGYWSSISGSIKDYFDTNMSFLDRDVREIFTKNAPFVETKPKDEPPAKYNSGAQVNDAIIGSGSILNGIVEHSVIFRKVYTGENSIIKNSIIMEGSYIGNNCVVENAILDKDVVLSDGKTIIGEGENPIIIKKGSVI